MFHQLKIWLGILLLHSFVLHDGVALFRWNKTYIKSVTLSGQMMLNCSNRAETCRKKDNDTCEQWFLQAATPA